MKITKISGSPQRTLRVAAYCRVSTEKEEQQSSFSIQQTYYMDKIRQNPRWELAGIYTDEGRSGTRLHHREGFLRLMNDAKRGQIDLILVKSISRFARNAADCQTSVRTLRNLGVEIRFEREGISNMDAASDFIFSMLAVVAQEESRSISENVRWRYLRSFREGVYHLGSHRILGYDMDETGRLIPNQDAWIVQRIFSNYLKGMGLSQIASDLNRMGGKRLRSPRPFDADTVRRMLCNVTYSGDLQLQKTAPTDYLTHRPMTHREYTTYHVTNDHPAIITPAAWRAAQKRLEESRLQRQQGIFRDPARSHVLYGLVFCGECQSPMLRKTYLDKRKRLYRSWCCQGRLKDPSSCHNPSIREALLTKKISAALGQTEITEDSSKKAPLKRLHKILVSPTRIHIQYSCPPPKGKKAF
ncbi:MAG: recombinase family protein [Eubacteriales bacterium]|nr:recombinase family protein [Eubacteriales bacterium]